ncbi:MAG: ferredoxin family protein [Chloroflexi bacterium]|nr:ferredoxin family protein [Chloroflexota bacterium]
MTVGKIIIHQDRCKGCTLCSTVCPQHVIHMDDTRLNARGYHPALFVDNGDCTGCAVCAVICPDVCITVYREAPAPKRARLAEGAAAL